MSFNLVSCGQELNPTTVQDNPVETGPNSKAPQPENGTTNDPESETETTADTNTENETKRMKEPTTSLQVTPMKPQTIPIQRIHPPAPEFSIQPVGCARKIQVILLLHVAASPGLTQSIIGRR